MLMCKVINTLMKAVGCSHRAAADFATTVDREVCLLASCLICAWALLEYVIFILWVCSFSKMLTSMKVAEDKVLV